MSSNGMVNVGNVHDLGYWCESQNIFKYLDTVSPVTGTKFKCPVCSGTHWGCSTVELQISPDEPPKALVAPCQMPVMLPNGEQMQMQGKTFPNYHYPLICLTCSNTLFLNAAMVQARLKVTEGLKDGQ